MRSIPGRSAFGACAVLLVFAIGVSAAGAGRKQARIKNGGTLTVGLAEDPDALDPTLARTFVGRMVFTSFCEKLYDINKNLDIVPQLAASLPKISADKKTVTIKLRTGIKFNDGAAFNAQAVKTSLDRHRTLARSARASELTPVDSVDAVGRSTVVLHLNTPFAPLTSLLADRAGMIMSPAALAKGGTFASDPVCVGAFQFVSRTAGDKITFKKSNFYYNKKKVHLSGIVYRIINQPSAMTSALLAHDIDVADRMQSSDLPAVRRNSSVKLIRTVTLGYQGLTINIGNKNGLRKPYQNVGTPLATHPGLREALELSLDRNAINRIIFNGTVTPDCGPISPVLKSWRDAKLKCPKRNVTRAKQLVRASGVSNPTVTLMIGNDTLAARLGQLIQSEAEEAGFKISLQPTEFTASLNRADAGNFDAFAVGFSGRVDPDGTVYGFVHTGGSLNDSGYSSAQVDRLMDQARSARTQKARHTLYNAAFRIVLKDRPLIYLWHPNNYTGVSKKVAGVNVFGDGLIRVFKSGKT